MLSIVSITRGVFHLFCGCWAAAGTLATEPLRAFVILSTPVAFVSVLGFCRVIEGR